ncbi:MAG: GTPase HflX [Bacteriovoracaceae bacterium]|nr:GTPase HflX [Bacteriovoracaceae bacterium]
MFDNEFHIFEDSKASLVSIVCPTFKTHSNKIETMRSLVELRELLRTLGIEAGSEYVQNRKTLNPATLLGAGRLIEIASQAKEEGSNLLVFDFELTAGQIRNIKKLTNLSVVDRCHVILEIFAKHARTREAKIQIEMARLKYLLPRLAGFWGHLSRQRGGVGHKGGEGEQQIELDRRIIRQRIEYYKIELKNIAKSRKQQRKKRKNKAVTAALVGYTNAGKSSLMNRLCKVSVLEEDQLFATLDSTYRTLNPDTKPPMILIDTVGFISNLPNTLIDGFKTTLESVFEADLLIIICDISDPNYKQQLEVTTQVLKELGVKKKDRIIVFNKKDKLPDVMKQKIILRSNPKSFLVSTFEDNDMNKLRDYIISYFLDKQDHYDLFIPYDDGTAHSLIESKTNIVNRSNHEKGIFYRILVPHFIFDSLKVKKYILAPDDPFLLQQIKSM